MRDSDTWTLCVTSDSYLECVCKCVGVFPCAYGYVDVCLHKKCPPHLFEEDTDDEEGVHAKHGEKVHPYVVLETSPVVSYKNGDDTDDGVKPDMMTHTLFFLLSNYIVLYFDQ